MTLSATREKLLGGLGACPPPENFEKLKINGAFYSHFGTCKSNHTTSNTPKLLKENNKGNKTSLGDPLGGGGVHSPIPASGYIGDLGPLKEN